MIQKLKSNKVLGQRLRTLRLENDFHVVELATAMQLRGCNITRETLVKIESGKRHITIKELIALKETSVITVFAILHNHLPMPGTEPFPV